MNGVPLFKSFRFRILLVSILVEIAMLSFLIYNSVRLVDHAIHDQTNIRMHSVRPLLEAALGTKLFQRDFASTNEILHRLISSEVEGFKYIVVFDESHKVFAQAGNVNLNQLPQLDTDIGMAVNDGVYDTISPLNVGNYQVGSARYGVSIASFLKSKSDLIQQGLIIAMVEISLTILVLSLTGYFLTRHIGELLRFANRVTSGDYDASGLKAGGDEFGVLSSAFQRMTLTIKQRIDELFTSEQALARSQAEFESMFNSISESVFFVDRDRVVIMTNHSVESMFGYHPQELIGKTLEFLYDNELEYHAQAPRFVDDLEIKGGSFEAVYLRKDGTTFIGENYLSPVRDAKQQLLGFVGIVRDVTERIEAQRALAESRERAQVTLESIGDAVITTDTRGVIQYLNPVAESITEWSLQEAIDQPLEKVFHVINEFTERLARNPVEECLRLQRIVEVSDACLLVSRSGREYYIEDSAAPIRNYEGDVIGAVLVFHDVTKTRSMSRQLAWQASHDSLTGLLNRNQFEAHLQRALVDASKHHMQRALLYIDLDQFKLVNDTCGHVAGDELLRQVSRLLETQLRETDYLSRMGGDEFGVLLDEGDAEAIHEIADRLRRTVEEFVFVWEDNSFRIGASIGVVQINEDSENLSSIMSAADMACYMAKDSGRNRIHIHTPDDRELAQRHGEMHWVTKLNLAIEEDRFDLYCQRIAAIAENENSKQHYEILLRLQEGKDVIQPMAFIPAAERYNLMPQLDRWVVSKVFDWLDENRERFDGTLTINLSGMSLGDKDFLPFVVSHFESGKVKPEQVCFEITETAAITNLSLAMGFIAEIKRHGASFALDDFGSGLSSFNYLKNLDVDYIKIDGSFVRDIDKDLVSYTMVESICHVSRVMGLKTIAEFVESESVRRKIADLGVDYMQGYWIHRPSRLAELLAARAGKSGAS